MEDINQLELAAYIIVVSREITEYSNKTIDNYIDLLKNEILKTPNNAIIIKARMTLFNKFEQRHSLNLEECINYAKLIFHRLLVHSDRIFSDDEIISVTKEIFNHFSIRTAKEEIAKLKL